MTPECPRCGAPAPPGARKCPECGGRYSTAPGPGHAPPAASVFAQIGGQMLWMLVAVVAFFALLVWLLRGS